MIKILPSLVSRGLLVLASCTLLPSLAEQVAAQELSQPVEQRAEQVAVRAVYKINPTTYEVQYHDGRRLSIDFYTEAIVRLFQDPKGGIIRAPQATPPAQILVDQPRKLIAPVRLQESRGAYILTSDGQTHLEIDRISGLFRLVDKAGRTVVRQLEPTAHKDGGTELRLSSLPEEYYYGGGVQNGRFSHRGKKIEIVNTNSWVDGGVASPTPFYWSTAGYGLMWHTFRPGVYDFGAQTKGEVHLRHEEGYLDVFLMASSTPIGLLNAYYQLTGKPVLMPKFGFYQGHLNAYNRDYWKETDNKQSGILMPDGKYYTESQKDNGGIKESLNGEKGNYLFSARAALDRYLNNDMPLGWFLPNDGYGAGYGQTATLDGNIENLRQFGDYARSRGVEIGLWTQSDLHPKEGIEALLQRDIVKEVRDAGVRVLKTDVAWVGAGYSFGLNGVADAGQIMPYYGSDARPFIISLDGWAGTQRYATIWSGDQTGGEWEYIRFHIPTFIGSGLSGQPNITSDVDGIFGGRNPIINTREFQWKTFTPMELNMDGWGSNPKYPDALGEPATSINRWYLKLKSRLMPYAYTIAREAVDGAPIIRAMMLEYPNSYTLGTATQYQFLWGRDFLIAPIYQATASDAEGNDVRHGIYLPEGTVWYDYFTGERYEGGRIINHFSAPLWKTPVFVRAGAIIPMTHAHNTPSEVDAHYRAYEVYPAEGAQSFTEYDDDGRTQAYLQGDAMRTNITSTLRSGKLQILIAPSYGKPFEGYTAGKRTELFVNLSQEPKAVQCKIGGKKRTLRKVTTLEEYQAGQDVYYYAPQPNLNQYATPGTAFAQQKIYKNPQLWVKLSELNTQAESLALEVQGVRFEVESSLLQRQGALPTPALAQAKVTASTITPTWQAVEGADYYEIEHEGRIYSTIRATSLLFDALQPDTEYKFRLRAVNRDGAGQWSDEQSVRTSVDPLLWAVKGVGASVSCADQAGTPVSALVDGDEKSMWHSSWSAKATPFTLELDLKAVYDLDKLQYIPREDAGNGTWLLAEVSYSQDRQSWSTPFRWEMARSNKAQELKLGQGVQARYIRLAVSDAVGSFGSGRELYVFRQPNTEGRLQGDINKDKRIDENDLTSYMNYTGLRRGDADFEYVEAGDLNGNGLIDAYDISHVATQLAGGVKHSRKDVLSGKLELSTNKMRFRAGEEVEVLVRGSKDLKGVNALSFALSYDPTLLEYVGTKTAGVEQMENLTYDRLHSNGVRALYPTFVNLGQKPLLSGDAELFVLRFRAKKAGQWTPRSTDGILVDRSLNEARWTK